MTISEKLFFNLAATELTAQQTMIARLVSEGWNNDSIAGQLFIDKRTVEKHLNSIYQKLESRYDCTGRNKRTFLAAKYREFSKPEETK